MDQKNHSGKNDFELLTQKEFCDRLKISRTTLFEWKKAGILKPGIHYFQVGSVVRYIYDKETIKTIHYRCETKYGDENQCNKENLPIGNLRYKNSKGHSKNYRVQPKGRKNRTAINLNY